MAASAVGGRQPSPTVGIIDRQSVEIAGNGDTKGSYPARKGLGHERRTFTETTGFAVGLPSHTADAQDPSGAALPRDSA
jgi:hypothetical protein